MITIRYTLLADGPTDRALMPIIDWALRQQNVALVTQRNWADLSRLPRKPKRLAERMTAALNLYPCDLLCIHRDAEWEDPDVRQREIDEALAAVRGDGQAAPAAVALIPVRMHEAWLLFDEAAIRFAAGNPNETQPLDLPPLAEVERMPDPKLALRQALRGASGLHGRRLERVELNSARIADLIDDWAPLRRLSAFQRFEAALALVCTEQGWLV